MNLIVQSSCDINNIYKVRTLISIMQINDFFNNLERDIRRAKTNKALKGLMRRNKSFFKQIAYSPLSTSSMKKSMLKKFRRAQKLIKSKEKKIK